LLGSSWACTWRTLRLRRNAAAPGNTGPSGGTAPATVGHQAPDGTFTALSGQNVSVTSLRGKPTLLWFVSTWCSSCQAGTSAMAHDLAELKAAGVRVDEVELYRDLGQSGPAIRTGRSGPRQRR
jgi:thiol-disulfide isomerase/thioredoxin